MIEGYEERLKQFMEIWEVTVRDNYKKQFGEDTERRPLETNTRGRRYTKIFSEGSVCAFVDKNTGDIYKPAGWKAPAKHVRGNIFSKDFGMEAVSTGTFIYSVRYLR